MCFQPAGAGEDANGDDFLADGKMQDNFSWRPGAPLPGIERHTLRKLDVLRDYLDVYFDTVVSDPRLDCLNITLVDGFAGGGAYQNGDEIADGSPLVLLHAVERARERLNRNRKKPLEINARFFFIDDKKNHIDALYERLHHEGFSPQIGREITVIKGKFSEELPDILTSIKAVQRAGRSIFVLDQFGYTDVPMESIRLIFSQLERPEVLLTFAIDGVLNYLQQDSSTLERYRQLGIDDHFIAEWNANKHDPALGRLISQRALMANIQMGSGADYFTPFMLWSPTDSRWMMFAHLSRHQAARDKMLGVHWQAQNSFRHLGRGSLFSLGFDTRLLEAKDALFNFAAHDKQKMIQELLGEVPREISIHMKERQLPVEHFLRMIGNRTAATNEDLFSAIKELALSREVEVISKKGTSKRIGSRIEITDRLVLPLQGTFFPLN
ncbi:MAG: hypothetical protein CMO03_10155 [Thalassospira sp.]|uniref:Three-Cys-motif partner protein n=2 Tax=Thalassospiraceae TaxID=2844866 RepID=A0ABR5XYF9_9PROT|nr:hypothetical protein AUP40_20315 [Thalassospira xiamenensis]MAB31901.1 hypothetical protein [Thalassospira sp.]MAL29881.1 hypothetical protein [Thalassospira sp.]OHZ03794.1 hypothetical protein BC440_05170 [Thalassospira sp. MIT1004]OSQ27976.1 hypothetical protein TH468_19720 [Thalassospira sp. MCCC 1A03138]